MDSAEYIINNLEGIYMNTLPDKVKLFVQTCDPLVHQYDQRTSIGTVSNPTPTRTKVNIRALTILFCLEPVQIEFPDNDDSTLIKILQPKFTTKANCLSLHL